MLYARTRLGRSHNMSWRSQGYTQVTIPSNKNTYCIMYSDCFISTQLENNDTNTILITCMCVERTFYSPCTCNCVCDYLLSLYLLNVIYIFCVTDKLLNIMIV